MNILKINNQITESKLQSCRNTIKNIANEVNKVSYNIEKQQVQDTIKTIKLRK